MKPEPVEIFYTADDALFDRSEVGEWLRDAAILAIVFLLFAAYWRFV